MDYISALNILVYSFKAQQFCYFAVTLFNAPIGAIARVIEDDKEHYRFVPAASPLEFKKAEKMYHKTYSSVNKCFNDLVKIFPKEAKQYMKFSYIDPVLDDNSEILDLLAQRLSALLYGGYL